MKYVIFPCVFVLLLMLWFVTGMWKRYECSGNTPDGSTFVFTGMVFVWPYSNGDNGLEARFAKEGKWRLSEFAADYAIDPSTGMMAYSIKQKPVIWCPVQYWKSSPDLEFPHNIANQYNNNQELKLKIRKMPKEKVISMWRNHQRLNDDGSVP